MSGTARWRAAIAPILAPVLLVPLAAFLVTRALSQAPHPSATGAPPAPPAARAEAPPLAAPEAADPAVRGRVLDGDGNPVAGATVFLVSATPPFGALRDARTDAAGAFAFAPGGAPRARVVAVHDPEGVVSSADLRLDAAPREELTLVLAPSIVRGSVVDAEGRPVAGAALALDGAPWMSRTATSDASGGFVLSSVPHEAGGVFASARGFRAARVAIARRGDETDVRLRIQLVAGAPAPGDVLDPDGHPVHGRVVACAGLPTEVRADSGDDGTFELPPSAVGCTAYALHDEYAASDAASVTEGRRLALRLKPGGAIEGVVVDEHGARLDTFTVGIESSSIALGRGPRRKVASEGGAFRLEKLPPGRYVLTATAPGRPPTRSDPVDVSGGATASGVRIVVLPGGSIAGRVFDEHRAPLAGVELMFEGVSSVAVSTAGATTDENGRYRIDGAPAGPFTLLARKEGFRARMLSGLRVDSGATLSEDVMLADAHGGRGLDFGGIGASISSDREGIALGGLFPGAPADRAGLRDGDRVTRIDGDDTSEMSPADVVQRLRGEAGTAVGVSIVRPSTGESIDVVIERAAISR